jgi:hypothetical protein
MLSLSACTDQAAEELKRQDAERKAEKKLADDRKAESERRLFGGNRTGSNPFQGPAPGEAKK